MSFLVLPTADYRTISGALAGTSKTEIFTASDLGGVDGALVVALRVVDSTGSVNTALTVHCQISSGDTERVLDRTDSAIAADFAYEFQGSPLVLGSDGTIDLTGGNGHHWFLTVLPLLPGAGSAAQR